MCGIFGWTFRAGAPLSAAQRETLAGALAIANGRRGPHSWGVYALTRKGDGWEAPDLIRRVGNIALARGVGALGMADVMMAHTRWATNGAVSEENCHPFVVGDVTLAHNGMVYNHKELAARYGRECPVDSLHLAHHLAEGRSFEEMEGYGTVEYVRASAPTDVHLARMQSGHLAIHGLGTRKEPWGVVWSSDGAHLRAALAAARVKHFPYEGPTEGRVYVASADGVLYVLPEEVSHRLAAGSLTPEERRRNLALTSGNAHASPGAGGGQRSGEGLRKRKSAKGKRREERRRQREREVPGASGPGEPVYVGATRYTRGTVGARIIEHAARRGREHGVVTRDSIAEAVAAFKTAGAQHSTQSVEWSVLREMRVQRAEQRREEEPTAKPGQLLLTEGEEDAQRMMDSDAAAWLSVAHRGEVH